MQEHRPVLWALLVLVLGGAGAFATTQGAHVEAADHLDPPHRVSPDPSPGGAGAEADRNSDIADVYAWTEDDHMTLVMSFAGPNAPADLTEIPCDRDVLYEIHLDNDVQPDGSDADDEFTIQARFGEDDVGNCMVQFSGIPGIPAGATIEGAVEHTLSLGDVRAYAGLRDDAFFFDLQGFRETVSMAALRFANDRDFFQGLNTPAIVIEFPTLTVSPTGEIVRVWGSTSRFTP